MSKLSRAKGHSFERTVAIAFREAGFPNAKRKLEYQVDECVGVDLEGVGPYRVQCKRLAKYPSINTIKEISDKTGVPILVCKADHEDPMAVLPFAELMKLIQVAEAYDAERLGQREFQKTLTKKEVVLEVAGKKFKAQSVPLYTKIGAVEDDLEEYDDGREFDDIFD